MINVHHITGRIFVLLGILVILASGLDVRVFAQTSNYVNTAVQNINGTTGCAAGNSFTKTFIVPGSDNFTLADLNVGFIASHTWRGDIRVDLTSPAATTVRIITSETNNTNQDNYNILLDDAAGTLINNAPHNTNDNVNAAPYENLVRPNNALSAFNGENSVGTWTMTICDDFPGADNGQFRRGELIFTHAVGADLSLALAASTTTPNIGTNVVLTFTLSNAGPESAGGVTTQINLPTGLSYVSDNGGGDYNSGTGVWTIPGSLSVGVASLSITAFVNSSGSFVTTGEVSTSNKTDVDSTPGNGILGEDDDVSLTLNPVTPAVPTLSCPGAPSILDWDTVVWPTGTLNNTYTVDGETIVINITDVDNTLLNNAAFGGQTPAEAVNDTGGLVPGQSDLHFLRDPPNRTSSVDVTYTLGTAGIGVSKLQLSLFDIDSGNNQFVDQVTVTGSLNGSNVPVTLFTGTANSASGNVVTGNGPSTPTQSNGNMTVEFNSAVDTVVLSYNNGNAAPVNPGNQGMALHDLNFCPPTNAVLSAQKSLTVFDPFAQGLYALPGNDVVYSIVFTNSGDGPADNNSLEIIDRMPPEIEFYNGDIDDAGPFTDPVVGIDSGSGLTLTYATDVRFSNAGLAPANFAACGYTPVAGYDPNVTFICFNPKGAMAAGTPDPSFEVRFRARIK